VDQIRQLFISLQNVFSSHVLRWAGNVGRVGKEEMYTGFWWRKSMLRDNFEVLNVDGHIILRWTLNTMG
jgi:hypothetical protein